MEGAFRCERAASDAERDPESSLLTTLWSRNRCCSCSVSSGPRYCDRSTVRRFSYLQDVLAHGVAAMRRQQAAAK